VQKVLVTGGAGFIGSNLTHRLASQKIAVDVVDNLLTGAAHNLPEGLPWHQFDCSDSAFVTAFSNKNSDKNSGHNSGHNYDAIVHLAGASSAPLFDAEPNHMHGAVSAFQNSLEIARRCDAKVAFASTSSFYARCEKPYKESMHVTPATLYECSKLSMEHLGQSYAATYGLDVSALRFFSVYGPREQGKGRFANIVSQFLWAMRAGEQPTIYGDGSQTRDFTYVGDLLDGLMLTLQHTKGFEAYNIGTGVEHTFNDVVRMLNEALGTDIEPRYIANPVRNYVQETLADSSKLQALGWKPRVNFREGIAKIVALDDPISATLLAKIRV